MQILILELQTLENSVIKNKSKGGGFVVPKSVKIIGSKTLESSQANAEIIPDAPDNWNRPIILNKFAIINYDDCTLIVNGEEIFLKSGQGFTTDFEDVKISSVKIKESGIAYNWIGSY